MAQHDGGKGDKQIPPKDLEQFNKNWDSIFKGQTMTTFTTEDRIDMQRTPLTDEQIKQIYLDMFGFMLEPSSNRLEFARAIERAHGIGND
jgi:hypothetical protein